VLCRKNGANPAEALSDKGLTLLCKITTVRQPFEILPFCTSYTQGSSRKELLSRGGWILYQEIFAND